MSYYNKSRSGRLNYEINDDGIEAIAPNLAKTISDMDRVLKEITTYEDDIEARTASLDDDDYSPHNSWDQSAQGRDGAYYDGDDNFYDDDDGELPLSFGEKIEDLFYSMSACVGFCCERIISCLSSQPKKVWFSLAGVVILGLIAGGGVVIAKSLTPGGSEVKTSSSNSEEPISRDETIASLLNSVSDPSLFENKDSLQRKARDWLISSKIEGSEKVYIQRYVIALFYLSLDGSNWASHNNWLDLSVSECDWFGVECGNDNMITELNLSQNNLVGSIPSEVKNLDQLEKLILSDNNLNDSIDNIFELKNLRHLEIANSQMNGSLPQSMGSMSRLGEWIFHFNLLNIHFLI